MSPRGARCAVIASWIGLSSPVAAQPADETSCVAAFERGQDLDLAGRLLEARSVLAECSRIECPALVREECASVADRVNERIPRVVVVVNRGERPLIDVRVLVDGRELQTKIDGIGREIDPGVRVFRAEVDGAATQRRVTIVEADRRQKVVLELDDAPGARTGETLPPAPEGEPPEGDSPQDTSTEVPTGVYVLGAVAAAGLGSFAYFGLTGESKQDELETCRPFCRQEDVDTVRRHYVIADVSLGVAVLSIGAATYWMLSRDDAEKAPPPAAQVTAGPTLRGRGWSATVRGRF